MFIYIVIFILLLACSIQFDLQSRSPEKSTCFVICISLLIIVSALSFEIGIDTISYMESFRMAPTLSNLTKEEIFQGKHEPLWQIMVSTLKTFELNFTALKIIVSITLNVPVGILIYRYSERPFISLLLYYLLYWITLNFESIRQSMAMGFYFWGCLSLIRNDKKHFILKALPMIFFHKTGIIVFFLTLIFQYVKNRNIALLSVVAIFVISLSFNTFFASIVDVVNYWSEDMANTYSNYMGKEEQGMGTSKNISGIIFPIAVNIIIPLILAHFYYLDKGKENKNWLGWGLTIFAFLGSLQFSFVVIGRLMQYLFVFYLIALPSYIMKQIDNKRISIITIFIILFTFINVYVKDSWYFDSRNPFVHNGIDDRYIPYRCILFN